MEILAQRLTELRKERKLSQRALGEAIQIGARTYQRYESAEREPTASVLVALADFFDVSADYLLGRSDIR